MVGGGEKGKGKGAAGKVPKRGAVEPKVWSESIQQMCWNDVTWCHSTVFISFQGTKHFNIRITSNEIIPNRIQNINSVRNSLFLNGRNENFCSSDRGKGKGKAKGSQSAAYQQHLGMHLFHFGWNSHHSPRIPATCESLRCGQIEDCPQSDVSKFIATSHDRLAPKWWWIVREFPGYFRKI